MDSFDPDSNFFNRHGFINTTYFTPETLKAMLTENNGISFSVLHLNIRGLNKNFGSLKNLLVEINFCFKVICITESCCFDDLHTSNRYQLPNYVSIHQVRKNCKTGGGITVFVHKELIYNIRHDLSVNDEDTEAPCLEMRHQKSKNIFINTIYRQPFGNKKDFENYLGKFLEKTKTKIIYLLGDFNLNLLNYDTNCKVKSYCNTAFSHNFIPIINKPTCVTNHNATIIDHILTNSFDSKIDTGILKVDISDNFLIFFTSKSINVKTSQDPVFVTKCDINPFTLSLLKEKILKVDWGLLHTIKDPNEAYKIFLNVFSNLYEIAFPKIKIKVNSKTLLSPWITCGILKSSKRKQRLYEKFLKNRNSANKENYKTFARLFESIKQISKKNCYHNLLITYEYDIKRTWPMIKETIGSKQSTGTLFPKRLAVNDLEFFDKKTIAENFNKFL